MTERTVATTSLRCFVTQQDIANMALYLRQPVRRDDQRPGDLGGRRHAVPVLTGSGKRLQCALPEMRSMAASITPENTNAMWMPTIQPVRGCSPVRRS